MPTVDLKPRSFSVWSSLQLAADQFEAEIFGIGRFEAANRADRVDLTTGFYDGAGVAHTVGKLKKGLIQEYVLNLSVARGKVEVAAQVRGFDQAALLLETQFNMRFLHAPVAASLSTSNEVDNPSDPNYVPKVVGVFSASGVAAAAAAAASLTLRWEAPDYTLNEDFVASGRAIDTIYALVRPYQICEPFKVDVLLMGDVVLVRERTPDMVAPPDTNVFSIKDARIKSLNIRRKRAIKYGTIRLRGCPTVATGSGFGATPDPVTGGLVFVAGEVTKESEGPGITTDPLSTFVAETVTWRMPDQIVTYLQRRTYIGGKQVSTETNTYDWEPTQYSLTGPVNQPKQRGSKTVWEGYAGNPSRWRETKTDQAKMTYDSDGFLARVSKLTRALDTSSGTLKNSDMQVVSYKDIGPLWVEQITQNLKYDKKKDAWGPANTVSQISAGHRPGGPGRGAGTGSRVPGQGTLGGQLAPVEVTAVLSTDADVINIDESFSQMDAGALAVVLDRLTRAHNLAEFESNIAAKSIPWMGRAEIIQFTGAQDTAGNTITLQPMLIHELRADYKADRGNVSLDSKLKAVFWKSEA